MNSILSQWKNRHKSVYYLDANIPDLVIKFDQIGLLIVDIQNVYLDEHVTSTQILANSEKDIWKDFNSRLKNAVIPKSQQLLQYFRDKYLPVFFARIACLTDNGIDRSLSQKRPGFNNVILPYASTESQIVEELKPRHGEIVVSKTTDSAITGTNLNLILRNMDIKQVVVCGIFTDQCISSTVRSLADESFDVILIEDACTALTEELHNHELEIINNIYCQALTLDEFFAL